MTTPATPEAAAENPRPPQFVIRVTGRESDPLFGRYIEGPREAKAVRRSGYGFTEDAAKAWPFPNRAQAEAKMRIIARHMGMSEMQFEVLEEAKGAA